jgi:hypothetical protein
MNIPSCGVCGRLVQNTSRVSLNRKVWICDLCFVSCLSEGDDETILKALNTEHRKK